jgi:hypothetical protein
MRLRERGARLTKFRDAKRVVSEVAGTFDHIGLHMSGYCTIENDIHHCGVTIAKLPSLAFLRDLTALEPSCALMATLKDSVHLDTASSILQCLSMLLTTGFAAPTGVRKLNALATLVCK